MSSANLREVKVALAYRHQANISTLPTAGNFWSLSKTNNALAVIDPKTEDDALDLGKGEEFPNNVFPVNQDANVPYEKYASSEILSYLAVFGLGKFTKTSPVGSSYLYTCTPLDPVVDGIELPFTAYVETMRQGGSAIFDRAAVGCVVGDWGLDLNSGPGRQNAKVNFNLVGSGIVTSPSTITVPTAFVEHSLNAGSAAISILGHDYVAAKELVSLSFRWSNNIRTDQGLYPGSGINAQGFQVRGRLENADRVCSVNFKARLQSTSTQLADLLAQTEGTAVFSLTGALISGSTYHGCTFTFPRVRISAAVVDDDQGIVTVSVTLRALKDVTDGYLTIAAICAQDNIGSAAA